MKSLHERHATLVPVWRELPADLETPVSAYLKLAHGQTSFLLESVEGGERLARYSFAGSDPYLVLSVHGETAEYHWLRGENAGVTEQCRCSDPLGAVRTELERRSMAHLPGLPRFTGGAVGYLGFENAARFEPTVPTPPADPLGLPDAMFAFYDTVLIFDHVRHTIHLLTHLELRAGEDNERTERDEA